MLSLKYRSAFAELGGSLDSRYSWSCDEEENNKKEYMV